jgi:hypothetical protein
MFTNRIDGTTLTTRIGGALLIALVALSTQSYAAGWSADLTVSNAFVEGNNDLIVIYTSNGATYTSGCLVNSWIFIADTDARRSRAYATIVAALTSGKKIRFWYGDSCSVWDYHSASSVMLVN